MFNIADIYSGQLWMNKRQGLSIPLPYIMSQPVTDPETELGVGQQTLNLFMIQFFRTRGALLLDDPTIYFLSKLQPTIVVPPFMDSCIRTSQHSANLRLQLQNLNENTDLFVV